jgi:hypothetical protein
MGAAGKEHMEFRESELQTGFRDIGMTGKIHVELREY